MGVGNRVVRSGEVETCSLLEFGLGLGKSVGGCWTAFEDGGDADRTFTSDHMIDGNYMNYRGYVFIINNLADD